MFAGLVIGILRYAFSFPDNMDGLFKEINNYHVHYSHVPLTYVLSMISLSFGATLGPEAALVHSE